MKKTEKKVETGSTDPVLAKMLARAQAHVAKTPTPKKVKGGRTCLCGCGEQTKGGLWKPGHDAIYLSRKIVEIRTAAAALGTEEPKVA